MFAVLYQWISSVCVTEGRGREKEFSLNPYVNLLYILVLYLIKKCGFLPAEVLLKFLHQCHTAVHYSRDC